MVSLKVLSGGVTLLINWEYGGSTESRSVY